MSTHVALPINGGFAGYSPGSVAVAAGNYGQDQTTDLTVALTILALTSFNKNYFITGNITVDIVPSATMVFSDVRVLAGAVSVSITPNSEFSEVFNFAGGVSLQTVVAATMSFVIYVDTYVIAGAVPFSIGILSATVFDPYANIDVTVDVDTGSIAQTSRNLYGSINPTVDVNFGAIGAT